MKFRGITWWLCGMLFVAGARAQNSGPDDLPSAPSAVQQERIKPKAPPPAASAVSADPQAPRTSAVAEAQAAPQAEPPAAKSAPVQATPASPAKADQNSNPPDEAAATFTKTVNEVNVVFTVTDKHGRYVKNMAKSDFSVLDDN